MPARRERDDIAAIRRVMTAGLTRGSAASGAGWRPDGDVRRGVIIRGWCEGFIVIEAAFIP